MHASGKTSGSSVNSAGLLPEEASLQIYPHPDEYADSALISALPLTVYSYHLPKSVIFIPDLNLHPSNFALNRVLTA